MLLQEKEIVWKDRMKHGVEKSKDLVGGFLAMFGRDGRIVSENHREGSSCQLPILNPDYCMGPSIVNA